MNENLIHLAYYHHGYGGTSDWLTHTIVSAGVHALIYGVVFKVMRALTVPEAILLVTAGIVIAVLWARRRDNQGF